MMKPKFIKYFCKIAAETAKLSTAEKMKVGAVIVKDNRILSIGYNGTPAGWDNTCEDEVDGKLITRPEVLHAERNALNHLTKSTETSKDASMFITHSPCLECAKSIYGCGIKEVYFINEYEGNCDGRDFLESSNIQLHQVDINNYIHDPITIKKKKHNSYIDIVTRKMR